MKTLPEKLQALATVQDDVLTSHQLAQHLTEGELRSQIRGRRWQRAGRGVVVLHNGPLTELQRIWAAILQSPPGSAVSGPTAMALAGLHDPWQRGIHITIPCGQRSPGVGATIHWSRFLGEDDVHPRLTPRRTKLPRSVLDWASWQASHRAARTVVLRSLQSRKVTGTQLREALPSRGPCRHHAVITESISDAEGGLDSLPERDFRELVRAAGLPRPTHQSVRRRPSGRYYLDAGWDEYHLSAEVHGVHHFELEQRERDLDRHNDLVVDGESLLHFSSYAVRHHPEKVVDTLRRALYRRGWTEGTPPDYRVDDQATFS